MSDVPLGVAAVPAELVIRLTNEKLDWICMKRAAYAEEAERLKKTLIQEWRWSLWNKMFNRHLTDEEIWARNSRSSSVTCRAYWDAIGMSKYKYEEKMEKCRNLRTLAENPFVKLVWLTADGLALIK